MSDKKTITINPELFSIHNATRKKKSTAINKPIRLKTDNNKTLSSKYKKNRLLKQIREKQEENYNALFETKRETRTTSKIPNLDNSEEEKTSFESSLDFLKNIVDEQEKKKALAPAPTMSYHNHTLKMTHSPQPQIAQIIDNTYPNLAANDNNIVNNFHVSVGDDRDMHIRPRSNILPQPTYGCLKGGVLPTYRMLNNKNNTIKNYPTNTAAHVSDSVQEPVITNATSNNYYQGPTTTPVPLVASPLFTTNKNAENLKKFSEINQMKDFMSNQKCGAPKNLKYNKQKKTLRRTFHLGKSKVFNKVSVLISNRTIRKNITTKTQLLKQVPINEVRKYLIKKGFIKVGSDAPNDILRKMYESAILIGGEIQNHNVDNLLYNYLHPQQL